MEALSAYDPNIRWGSQRVKLSLMMWDYTGELIATVGGNCQGFNVFEVAIEQAFEDLGANPTVILTRADGDSLICTDDEERYEDWLRKMVVGMRIIAQEAQA